MVILIILGVICLIIGIVGCIVPGLAGPPLSLLTLIQLSFDKLWEPFSPAFLIAMAASKNI